MERERESTYRVWKQILIANVTLENIPNFLGFTEQKTESLISSRLIHYYSLDPRGGKK